MTSNKAYLEQHLGIYNDWPKPGVTFRDISPLFADPKAYKLLIQDFINHYRDIEFDKIATIDARGFLIASVVAYELGKSLLLVRKAGKLPGDTISQSYDLEYGSQVLEMQVNSASPNDKVVLFDDLIATGGSLNAAVDLIEQQQAHVVSAAAIIDLVALGGSDRLKQRNINVFSLLEYPS